MYLPSTTPFLMCIILVNDVGQYNRNVEAVVLILEKQVSMILSKSFGYALRGILYVALMKDEQRNVRLDEIARALSVPRHFLGKIMIDVVKAGILKSSRGQLGGFYVHEKTLTTPLIEIVLLTEGPSYFNTCLLSLQKCNASNPCPMHHKVEPYKDNLLKVYRQTLIGDLLNSDKPEFIQSIAVRH